MSAAHQELIKRAADHCASGGRVTIYFGYQRAEVQSLELNDVGLIEAVEFRSTSTLIILVEQITAIELKDNRRSRL